MSKDHEERMREMARSKVDKGDRLRAGYGSLLMQTPDMGCPSPRCVKRQDHPGDHWPEGT